MERGRREGKQPMEAKEGDDESLQSEDFDSEWKQIEDIIFNAKKPESSSNNSSTTPSTNSTETKIRMIESFQEDHLFYESQRKTYEVKISTPVADPVSINSSVRQIQSLGGDVNRVQPIQPGGGGVNLGQALQQPSDSAMLNRDRNGMPIRVNPQPSGTGVFHRRRSGSRRGTGVFHPLSLENRVAAGSGIRGGNNHGHPPLGRAAAGTTQAGRLCLIPKRGGAGSNQPKRGS